MGLTPIQRLVDKIKMVDGHWLWTGALKRGYGVIQVNGVTMQAHRFSYNLIVGLISENLSLDHLCRIRHCVNPAHLEPVTQKENILRGVSFSAINAKKEYCIKGHEFTPENTYYRKDRDTRECRRCRNDAVKLHLSKKLELTHG